MDILDLRPWPERTLSALDHPHALGGWILSPLSAIYRLGTALHRAVWPPRALPVPPVSIAVGNLRVGGTGKTPVCAELVRLLRSRGIECALLSRGYRSRGGDDEPAWLEQETGAPVILDAQRDRGVAEAASRGATAVVLDDAFQSRDQASSRLCILLARDLRDPPRVLPAGPAREGLGALGRAQGILVRLEGRDTPPGRELLPAKVRELPVFFFRMQPTELRDIEGAPVSLDLLREWGPGILVSGLARPQSLEEDALGAGAELAISLRFSDHARFGDPDLRRIERALRSSGAGWILTSEKNLSRLAALQLAVPVWALRSELQWIGDSPADWLEALLRRA
jgi:tetraacyldisaccharide 4'-kinase